MDSHVHGFSSIFTNSQRIYITQLPHFC